ncbi:MAG: radical SAM protein [Nibricoccus sp.]
MIVVWRITTRCNLACPFCAYDRRLPFDRLQVDASKILAFCETLAAYQRTSGDPVLVSWLGGEPLLLPELPELTRHATSLGLRVSATTNGTTLRSSGLRQHILDHYAELTVSLDAPDAMHDSLRGWHGGFASLQETIPQLSAARLAQNRPLKLRLNTVLLRSTISQFSMLARTAASWGVDELTFNTLGGRDRPEFFPQNRPTPAQLADFAQQLPALRAELGPGGLRIAGSSAYLDRLQASARNELRAIMHCGPGEQFLFIDELGRVSPCSFTSDTLGIPLADLDSPEKISALPSAFASHRRSFAPSVCSDCPSTHVFEKFIPPAA